MQGLVLLVVIIVDDDDDDKWQSREFTSATTVAIATSGEAFGPLLSSSYRKLCNVSQSRMAVVLVVVICISHLEGWGLEGHLSSQW